NLISYSDSIYSRYDLLETKSDLVSNAIMQHRQNVLNGHDSTNVQNLTWYTLYAETAVLEKYLMEVGFSARLYDTMLPTNISDSIYAPGDTVLVLVNVFSNEDDREFDFDQVSCKNEQNGDIVNPYITKIE